MTTRTTIAELIKKLQTLPPDANLVISGYEGGYDDVGINTTTLYMKEDVWLGGCNSIFGDHDEVDDITEADFTAIEIIGKGYC